MIKFTRLLIEDFRVIKKADIPLDDQGLVLITARNHDTTGADSNGSGKSTIFHALTWVLYGQMVGETRPGDLIRRNGGKVAKVTLWWTDGSSEYKLERKATKSGQKLTLWTDDVSTTERTRSGTEIRVAELLGLDFASFTNTVMYGQGDIKRFAGDNVTDADRKRVLKRALGMEDVDKALKLTRERLREAREEEHEAAVTAGEARRNWERDKKRLDDANDLSDAWDEEHESKINKLKARISELEGEAEEWRAKADQLERLEIVREQIRSILDTEEQLKQEVEDAEAEVEETRTAKQKADDAVSSITSDIRLTEQQLSTARSNVKAANAAARKLKSEADALEGVCRLCHTPMDESEHTQEHKAAVLAEAAEKEAEAAQAAAERDELCETLDDQREQRRVAQEVAREAKAAHDVALDRKRDAKAELEGLSSWRAKLKKVDSKISHAKESTSKAEAAEGRADELREQLDEVEDQTNPHGPTVESAKRAEQESKTRWEGQRDKAESIKESMAPLLFWEQGFSNKGLPSLMLDLVMPMVSESANGYLETLADGDITVEITPMKSNKDGSKRDEITITPTIEGNADVRPSGAQQSKISVAIDLGLMDLVASREGCAIDALFVDEVLDGLDAEGRRRVFQLLSDLRERRSTVLVISHDEEIKEHFEKVWTVVKKDRAATVEVEA